MKKKMKRKMKKKNEKKDEKKNEKKDEKKNEKQKSKDKKTQENQSINIEEPPELEDLEIIEEGEDSYYYSLKTKIVYEFANDDGDVGNRVGFYKNNKIIFS